MLKIETDEHGIKVVCRGSLPEIGTELVIMMQQIREGFQDNGDGDVFDFFLKNVLIDLVFAGNDRSKFGDILAESLRRAGDAFKR